MSDGIDLFIEPLHSGHQREKFNCGVESLNRYLQKQAGQDMKRRTNRVFIATPRDSGTKVAGFYSLSAVSIELDGLPAKLAKKLPRHPIPAALVGRLAVHISAQGKGVGKMMLADAVKRTLSAGEQIAVYALVVDAIDKKAENFYRNFGFSRLGGKGRRLFLPLKFI